jgi:hypothetical protein
MALIRKSLFGHTRNLLRARVGSMIETLFWPDSYYRPILVIDFIILYQAIIFIYY